MFLLFVIVAAAMLCFDIYSHQKQNDISLESAVRWSCGYVALALGYALLMMQASGIHDASLFLSGYMMEKALSVDNLIAFVAVFSYFGIPADKQRRILLFGIIGAAVMRMGLLGVIVSLFNYMGWVSDVIFAAIIGAMAYKMFNGIESDEKPVDHNGRWYIRLTKTLFPVTGDDSSGQFFVTEKGILKATPYFLCLIAIEVTDIMFSFDSGPTVVAVSKDPYIVYSATMLAVMGLRSMYFLLAALRPFMRYMDQTVSAVLGFVAMKLLLDAVGLQVSPILNMVVIGSILAAGAFLSVAFPDETEEPAK